MATRARTKAKSEPKTKTAPAVEVQEEVKEVPKPRVFDKDELISCRSMTKGELIFQSKKTDNLYVWSAYGDVEGVTYQDLYSLKVNKSRFIYDMLFRIEDEELLSDPKWKDVREMYDNMYSDVDVNDICSLPAAQFAEVFSDLPAGVKNAVKVEVATRIEDGTFDSLGVIREIDRVMGSDLMCLITQ